MYALTSVYNGLGIRLYFSCTGSSSFNVILILGDWIHPTSLSVVVNDSASSTINSRTSACCSVFSSDKSIA